MDALWVLRREEAAWIRRSVDVPMLVSFARSYAKASSSPFLEWG